MSHDRGCFRCGEDVDKSACGRHDCPRRVKSEPLGRKGRVDETIKRYQDNRTNDSRDVPDLIEEIIYLRAQLKRKARVLGARIQKKPKTKKS